MAQAVLHVEPIEFIAVSGRSQGGVGISGLEGLDDGSIGAASATAWGRVHRGGLRRHVPARTEARSLGALRQREQRVLLCAEASLWRRQLDV